MNGGAGRFGGKEGGGIGVLTYPGAMDSAVHGIREMFAVARCRYGVDIDEVVCVPVQGVLPRRVFDVLVIPPSMESNLPVPSNGLVRWLRAQHANGCLLASVCSGVFLLAPTGLLDGKAATTHWSCVDACRNMFPAVNFRLDQLLVEERNIITAGGITAWMDIVLLLFARHFNVATATALGKYFLVETGLRRQSFYCSFTPSMNHGDGVVADIQREMADRPAAPFTLSGLAKRYGMCSRTLQRRFLAATGKTPLRYLQQLRIVKASELLENTRLSLEQIVTKVGYADTASFRKLFLQQVGMLPSQYRERFSIIRGASPSGGEEDDL